MAGLTPIFDKLVSINKRDGSGRTQLYLAAQEGSIRRVRDLLKRGADPNIPCGDGWTPLHHAAYWGNLEIVKALVEAKAKIDADNGKGWTPLHSAAVSAGLKGRGDVIAYLKEKGASPDKEDAYGWTPRDYMQLWTNENPAKAKLRATLCRSDDKGNPVQPDLEKLGLAKKSPSGKKKVEEKKTEEKKKGDKKTGDKKTFNEKAGNEKAGAKAKEHDKDPAQKNPQAGGDASAPATPPIVTKPPILPPPPLLPPQPPAA